MKILVIGGSLFLGKAFVKLAGNHEIIVYNRGNRPPGYSRSKGNLWRSSQRRGPKGCRTL